MEVELRDAKGNIKLINVNVTTKRVKNINLRITNSNEINVSCSKWVSQKAIKEFILSKQDWILKVLNDNENRQEFKLAKEITNNDKEYFLFGKKYSLFFYNKEEFDTFDHECLISNNILMIKNKLIINSENDLWKKELKDYETKILKIKIRENLNYSLNKMNDLKLPIKEIKIATRKSYWGENIISKGIVLINRKLVSYDEECLRYVIIHELSHFVYADHSRNFWKIVEKYMPNYKEIKKILKDS